LLTSESLCLSSSMSLILSLNHNSLPPKAKMRKNQPGMRAHLDPSSTALLFLGATLQLKPHRAPWLSMRHPPVLILGSGCPA
jgi:hypothetical protein